MPLRDYKCESCNTEWEELRRDQSDPEFCPTCKTVNPKRLISKSNFQLKGTGWYKPSPGQ